MAEILEHQTLEINRLVSYRGLIAESDIENVKVMIEQRLKSLQVKRTTGYITAIYAMYRDKRDVEILAGIDGEITELENLTYKPVFKLVNAVVAKNKGNKKEDLKETWGKLSQYVGEKELQPTSVAYYIPNSDGTEVDIYMGISQNIL